MEHKRMGILSVNETTTFRWSFEEDVANYLAAGIPAIGVWRQKLSDCGETKGVDLLIESQLKVSHLFWAGGFTGSDGRSFLRERGRCRRCPPHGRRDRRPEPTRLQRGEGGTYLQSRRRLFTDALRELAPLAAELNVLLAVEPMHAGCAGEFTFLTSVDDVLTLLEIVADSQVRLILDTYHLGWTPELIRCIPQFVEQVALVQLGDGRLPPSGEQARSLLGEGRIPLESIVDALATAGYNGYYDVELLGEEIETKDYRSLLAHAKAAFERLVNR